MKLDTRWTIRSFIVALLCVLTLLAPDQSGTIAKASQSKEAIHANLLVNPGFEDGMSGWRRNFATSGSVHEIDDTTARQGNYSLRFSSTDLSHRGAVIQVINVVPGETYRFGFSRKLQDVEDVGRAGSHLRIQFKDADGADTAPLRPIARATGTRDWEDEQYDVIIPPNTERIYFEIMMDQATGITWWDDLFFRKADKDDEVSPGQPDEKDIQRSGCTPCTNMIPNGSFEQLDDRGLPVGFNTFVPAGPNQDSIEIAADDDEKRSGDLSVRISGEGGRAALAHAMDVKGGEAYKLEVWYKKSAGLSHQHIVMRVMAYFAKPHNQSNKLSWQTEWLHDPYESLYDTSGENLMIRPSSNTDGRTDWGKMSATFTLPEEVIGLDIHLFNSHGQGTIWFDDLSIERLHPNHRKELPKRIMTTPTLETLREGHPRLLAHESDFQTIQQLIEDDSFMRQWYAALSVSADRILLEPPAHYELPDGKRLLSTSRKVLERIETLAMKYRLDPNPNYLHRAWRELEAAAAFPDWNPPHFLDTAEMTRAFAIAYDWLYDHWTLDQQQLIRDAILEKGLEPALLYYRGQKPAGWQWSPTWVQNWNFVVNGGITIGALAIAEEQPEVAEEILRQAFNSVKLAVGLFGPDGAWDEGVSYWSYSIRFLIPYFAALETALGTDFGLAQSPGISEAGYYPIYLTGPINQVFNFADSGTGVPRPPEMFWLAERFDQPAFAGWHRQIGGAWGSLTNNLLWYKPGLGDGFEFNDLPLDKHFRGVEVATFRSAWQDKDAVFVGFKGGAANVNHGHLDLGDFVFDALGVRWAEETGGDNYNLEGYNNRGSGQRWMYYRTRAEGQNTIVINPGVGPDQDVRAFAPIIHQSTLPEEAVGIVDLTSAYPSTTRAWRGVALFDDRSQVIVQDEVTANEPFELWWFMHTRAQVQIEENGRTAFLQKDGQELMARILAPAHASFQVMDATPLPTSPNPEGQNANIGFRKLAIHLEDVTDLTLTVQLIPLSDGELAPVLPAVISLADWMSTSVEEERIWSPLPRMSLDMKSPISGQKVFGEVPVGLRMDLPDEIRVNEVTVALGDQAVYHGSDLPEEILVDTRVVPDGLYNLYVDVTLESGESALRKFPLRVENWWHLNDSFEPPHMSEWLGTLDRSRTYSTSDGWDYAINDPDDFFGDASRRVRTSQSAEHLIWSSPNLHHFRLSVYAPTDDVRELLLIEVSPDGEAWSEVAYELHVKERSSQGRVWLEATGQESKASISWIRVTLRESSLPYDEVQLGEMELRGLN